MSNTAKVLIPDREWIVKNSHGKLGSISKQKRGYAFIHKGKFLTFKNLAEVQSKLGISSFDETIKKNKKHNENRECTIYDFPCNSEPHNPVYNVKNKLPLYAKNNKSKSQYCAGYYLIKFSKGWSKSFCPKLITLERYPFQGPFKTLDEVKIILNQLNRNETT